MLEEELHFQLLRSFHFSNRAIVAQTSQLKLMPGQPKILLYLLEHDGAMAKEISVGGTSRSMKDPDMESLPPIAAAP